MTDKERRRLWWTVLGVKCSLELYVAAIVTLLFVLHRCGS